jgi:methylmalonyl-CoA/ethylmalonyl-CoA epimerase
MSEAASQTIVNQTIRLHHVGYVVRSISEVADRFAQSVAASWDQKIIQDPLQDAKVAFLAGTVQEFPLVELVEPASEASPVTNFLKKGGGLHHLCYEVESLDKQLEFSQTIGGMIVRPPLPAVAFAGRRIAWVYTKDRLLLEFLDAH